jgi:hypothetical protein
LPNAIIMPSNYRYFDALMIFHDSPFIPRFKLFSTSNSPQFVPRIVTSGKYDLTYLVCADNFDNIRGTFRLTLGKSLSDVTFEQIS